MAKLICNKCNNEKEATEDNFGWRKDRGYFRTPCKECVSKQRKEYKYKLNNIKEKKECFRCGKDIKGVPNAKVCKDCFPEYKKERQKKWNADNREYVQTYRSGDSNKRRVIRKSIKREKPKKVCRYCGKDITTEITNTVACNDCQPKRKRSNGKWWHRKRSNGEEYKLKRNISSQVSKALKSRHVTKDSPTFTVLGYSADDLKKHVELYFTKENGFTWCNYGTTWHLDHIIPQSHFNIQKMGDKAFHDCWALSNLRPMERIENIKKGNRYIGYTDENNQLNFIN